MGEETVMIIYTCIRCSVDVCSGDLQFISRLVRLVKHFMPASVLDPSKVHILHRNSCIILLCWVSSLRFVPAHHSPSVNASYMCMHLPFSFPLFSSPLLSSSLPSPPLPPPPSSFPPTIQHGYLHGKFCLLAFDEFYEKDGQRNRSKTTLVRHFLSFKNKVLILSLSLPSTFLMTMPLCWQRSFQNTFMPLALLTHTVMTPWLSYRDVHRMVSPLSNGWSVILVM